MAEADVKKTTTSSGLDQSLKIHTTDPEDVDRAGVNQESWQSTKWETYNSYYKNHLSANAVINKLAMWTILTGHNAEKKVKKITDKIVGWGKDTFDEVLDNQIRIKHINGDSYAEIITPIGEELNSNGSNLINLKPLNPGSLKHVVNPQGMLESYLQVQNDGSEKSLRLNQVFHLVLNRTADEIHGTGDIESLITFLDKIKQLDEDMTVMFHRFVVPLVIWRLNTDDPTAMATFKTQEKSAWNTGDNLIIPDTAVSFELLEAGKGVGKIINPMEWRNKWTEEVTKGGGVPALIMAIESGTTEASSKMVFLAWQVVIDKEQKSIIAQVKAQLGLEIQLPDPPKIDASLMEDEKKDGNPQKKIKPSETKATLPGAK
ncbi:MAG TPA: hypothetical protein ENI22_02780 [Candidatus Pacearchaeota archaeon]|nr:hypothetical protein [Candidatus Pacearchaeota archaeon]